MKLNGEIIKNLFGIQSEIYQDFFQKIQYSTRKEDLIQENYFIKWNTEFSGIYDNDQLDIKLFLGQAYLLLIIKAIYLKLVTPDGTSFATFFNLFSNEQEFEELFVEIDHFHWISSQLEGLRSLIRKVWNALLKFREFEQEDLFQLLYQDMISSTTRYKLGEFYTLNWLSDFLINESSFQIGKKALDPTCGSGTFIVGMYKKILNSNLKEEEKIKALEGIFGFDINPMAILFTKLNVFITLISNFDRGKKIWMRLRKNFQVKDCLNENLRELKVDLIIGNPPWITYKELSLKMQKKILELARFEKINPDSKNVANVEISTVFFYRTSELFLKKNGKIMFLTTRSLMNGSHAARFRKFNGFSTVILYQIMDQVFNTNTIAWFAIKNDDVYFSKHDNILSKIITNQKIQEEIYLYPLYNKEDEVGKLIPMNEKLIINEIKISPYAKSCFRGFSAFPRIFYFVKKEERENKIILQVDEDILKRSKGIWKEKSTYLIKKLNDFYNLNSENLRKYLFPILLSRGFEAFRVNEYFTMVLPITRDKSSGEFRFIDEEHEIKEIHLYHQLIDSFWKEAESSKKKQLNTIFKRLNYQGDLLKKEMFRPIKVVYNEAGSRLKSVVINDGVLIDITCYYIATSSLDEAHYLCSIFNSNTINESLSILKSDRHFHKRPVSELAIPKFDESNKIHQELVLLSKKCHALEQKKSINDEILKIDKLISSDFF